jgi:hypothetical protein
MMRFIGGKADGQQTPLKSVTLEIDGEQYIQIQSKEGGRTFSFYMLAGMVPNEALKSYRDRYVTIHGNAK